MIRDITAEQCAEMVSDLDWQRINAALPPNLAARARNKPRKYRGFIEAVLWVACNRAFWSELPQGYGPWRPVYLRYMRWLTAGIWDSIDNVLGAESVCGAEIRLLLEDCQMARQRRLFRVERNKSAWGPAKREAMSIVTRIRRS